MVEMVVRSKETFCPFKDREFSNSYLSEGIHSSLVTTKWAHMTLYQIIIDNVAENVTIKQTPKHYSNSRFGGGTGPDLKELEARKKNKKRNSIFSNNSQ